MKDDLVCPEGNDLTDPRTLIAVTANANQSKGDSDPSNWLPPLASDQCPYVGTWIAIKARWGLSMDQSEYGRIRNMLESQCRGLAVTEFPPPFGRRLGAAMAAK